MPRFKTIRFHHAELEDAPEGWVKSSEPPALLVASFLDLGQIVPKQW